MLKTTRPHQVQHARSYVFYPSVCSREGDGSGRLLTCPGEPELPRTKTGLHSNGSHCDRSLQTGQPHPGNVPAQRAADLSKASPGRMGQPGLHARWIPATSLSQGGSFLLTSFPTAIFTHPTWPVLLSLQTLRFLRPTQVGYMSSETQWGWRWGPWADSSMNQEPARDADSWARPDLLNRLAP